MDLVPRTPLQQMRSEHNINVIYRTEHLVYCTVNTCSVESGIRHTDLCLRTIRAVRGSFFDCNTLSLLPLFLSQSPLNTTQSAPKKVSMGEYRLCLIGKDSLLPEAQTRPVHEYHLRSHSIYTWSDRFPCRPPRNPLPSVS